MSESPFDPMMPDKERYRLAVANQHLLAECPKHRFDILGDEFIYSDGVPVGIAPGSRFFCSVCNGKMPALEASRYAQGYKAAGGDPNEIIPGYYPEPA
jgi:hypothetical protein